MAHTLEQDVRALKEWLRQAWRHLGEPSLTRFERQELRNQMKEADAALRAGLQKVAAGHRLGTEYRAAGPPYVKQPAFRILRGAR